MSVIAAYRRHGIGQALLEDALARSRAAGLRTVWLAVADANHPARALYAKLGFAPAMPPVPDWQGPGETVMQRRLHASIFS